jgi:large subunit ribosomal protein L4
MQIDVVNQQNEKVGSVDLGELFAGRVKTDLIHASVVRSNAAERRGTHATKNRALVSGSGKKPWRQKGTGRARQGSIRSPQWRGGGSVFGPRANRNFHEDLPKQVKRLARRSAFNARAQDGQVILIAALTISAPKTKDLVNLLETTGAEGNTLILTNGNNENVWMSARNLDGVQVRPFGEESTYDVLWADTVIIEAPALEKVKEKANA